LDRLQSSFELQRRFISNASHELSTPLTAILSQLEIALQRQRSNEDYQQIVASVIQDVKNLSKLTHTLLEFAKASGNRGGLDISLVRIDEVLMELPASMKKQDKNFEVALEFHDLPESEDDLLVFGNAELLKTAIQNIVSNACKYSSDHTAVVSLDPDKSFFKIHIKDRALAIPVAERVNIFQPFYRIPGNPDTQGFGLGLSLAHRIIRLHKGDISVTGNEGGGNVFVVTLPFARNAGL
jgi:signal transduction histidine kinase